MPTTTKTEDLTDDELDALTAPETGEILPDVVTDEAPASPGVVGVIEAGSTDAADPVQTEMRAMAATEPPALTTLADLAAAEEARLWAKARKRNPRLPEHPPAK